MSGSSLWLSRWILIEVIPEKSKCISLVPKSTRTFLFSSNWNVRNVWRVIIRFFLDCPCDTKWHHEKVSGSLFKMKAALCAPCPWTCIFSLYWILELWKKVSLRRSGCLYQEADKEQIKRNMVTLEMVWVQIRAVFSWFSLRPYQNQYWEGWNSIDLVWEVLHGLMCVCNF